MNELMQTLWKDIKGCIAASAIAFVGISFAIAPSILADKLSNNYWLFIYAVYMLIAWMISALIRMDNGT